MKKFFQRILLFIASLWNSVDKVVKKSAPIAIDVVNAVKLVNESFAGDIVEELIKLVIPGNAEDAVIDQIRARLRAILPKVILELNLVNSIANIQDTNEQLKAIINAINMSPDATKNAYYHMLCVKILEALSDGKLTWSESVQIAEYYYQNIYKKEQSALPAQ